MAITILFLLDYRCDHLHRPLDLCEVPSAWAWTSSLSRGGFGPRSSPSSTDRSRAWRWSSGSKLGGWFSHFLYLPDQLLVCALKWVGKTDRVGERGRFLRNRNWAKKSYFWIFVWARGIFLFLALVDKYSLGFIKPPLIERKQSK